LELSIGHLAKDGEPNVCAQHGRDDEQSVRHVDLLGSTKRDKRGERQNLHDENIGLIDTALGQLVPSTRATPDGDGRAREGYQRTGYAPQGSNEGVGQAATPRYDWHRPDECDSTVDRQEGSDGDRVGG